MRPLHSGIPSEIDPGRKDDEELGLAVVVIGSAEALGGLGVCFWWSSDEGTRTETGACMRWAAGASEGKRMRPSRVLEGFETGCRVPEGWGSCDDSAGNLVGGVGRASRLMGVLAA
jgi:hypothetical protein